MRQRSRNATENSFWSFVIALWCLTPSDLALAAATRKGHVWPAGNRPVPYILEQSDFPRHPKLHSLVSLALKQLAADGMKFRQIKSGTEAKGLGWVHFKESPGDSCVAEPGYSSARAHEVLIAPKCRKLGEDDTGVGEVLHEILHVLGFIHEHQRNNGRDYLDYRNMELLAFPPAYGKQMFFPWGEVFEGEIEAHGDYDFESIMHYPIGAVIHPRTGKTADPKRVGLGTRLSAQDKAALRKVYP